MEATVNKTETIKALQRSLADYHELLQIKSKIQLQMNLGKRYMWNGLCFYFEFHYTAEVAADFLQEISATAGIDVTQSKFIPFAHDLDTVAEIHTLALQPRIDLLEKTLKRLTNL